MQVIKNHEDANDLTPAQIEIIESAIKLFDLSDRVVIVDSTIHGDIVTIENKNFRTRDSRKIRRLTRKDIKNLEWLSKYYEKQLRWIELYSQYIIVGI